MADIDPKAIGQRVDLLTGLAAKAGLEISQAFLLAGMHEESLGLFVLHVDKEKNLQVATTPSAQTRLSAHEVISSSFTPVDPALPFGPFDMIGVSRAALIFTIKSFTLAPLLSIQLYGFDKGVSQVVYSHYGYYSQARPYLIPFPVYDNEIYVNVIAHRTDASELCSLSLLRRFL